MTFAIYTLGCRVNQYESRVISEKLIELGHTEQAYSDICDIYIINSCAVTAESGRKSRQMIRRAKKLNPASRVIVTGCLAQVSPDDPSVLQASDCIIGNKNKIAEVLSAFNGTDKLSKAESLYDAEYENVTLTAPTRVREYIKIQDGCEGKCTYCIIPRARGPVRSKPFETVIKEVEDLTKKGVREIILTGIEIASYEYDLAELLYQINQTEGVLRISMGSIEPTLITEHFVDKLAALDKLTPHFHISVQSGSTTVLNRMKRKYNAAKLTTALDILKSKIPNIQLTCDIIVGFPGESDKEFNETKAFLKRHEFLHAHIFPYSLRPETPAATMEGQIPDEIKLKRCAELFSLQKQIKEKLLCNELSREKVPVLFEVYKNGVNIGHSDNYIEYHYKSENNLIGELKFLKPLSFKDGIITAE